MSRAPFAAMLLAGGRSRRMGRDKALLPLPDGRVLWERQLAVLRELEPAELYISGPVRESFPADVVALADEKPGLGPLAGIVPGLKAMETSRLVVLAVDLPAMNAEFLRGMLDASADERGVVPQAADGFFEPLAAVYPRGALAEAHRRLLGEDRSMQAFVRALIDNGLATARAITHAEARLFANWNRPEDLLEQ